MITLGGLTLLNFIHTILDTIPTNPEDHFTFADNYGIHFTNWKDAKLHGIKKLSVKYFANDVLTSVRIVKLSLSILLKKRLFFGLTCELHYIL